MRNGRAISIPPPEDDDFEDVHWALTAATTLWDRGEDREALKWLRRAASAAADRDADVRAVELFKAAADVQSMIEAAEPVEAKKSAPSPGPPESPKGASPQRGSKDSGAADRDSEFDRRPPPLPPRSQQRGAPRAPDRPVLRSNLVPPVPPEPRVSSKPAGGRFFEESEQDTFILPETALRRALTDIDPAYPQRIDYDPIDGTTELGDEDLGTARMASASDRAAPPRPSGGAVGDGWDDEDDDEDEDQDTQVETQRRAKSGLGKPRRRALVPIGVLPALRVAVMHIPDEGDVRVLFLSPGATPPPGVATALLVPPTQRDAELLTEVYAKCDAKL